jgi:hypothetical protein
MELKSCQVLDMCASFSFAETKRLVCTTTWCGDEKMTIQRVMGAVFLAETKNDVAPDHVVGTKKRFQISWCSGNERGKAFEESCGNQSRWKISSMLVAVALALRNARLVVKCGIRCGAQRTTMTQFIA